MWLTAKVMFDLWTRLHSLNGLNKIKWCSQIGARVHPQTCFQCPASPQTNINKCRFLCSISSRRCHSVGWYTPYTMVLNIISVWKWTDFSWVLVFLTLPFPDCSVFLAGNFSRQKGTDEITRHMVMVLASFERNLLPLAEMNLKSRLVKSVSLFTFLSISSAGGGGVGLEASPDLKWLTVNSISLDCWSIQSWTIARPDGVFARRCPCHVPYRAPSLLFCLCFTKGEELILATGRWLKPSPMPLLRTPSWKSPNLSLRLGSAPTVSRDVNQNG